MNTNVKNGDPVSFYLDIINLTGYGVLVGFTKLQENTDYLCLILLDDDTYDILYQYGYEFDVFAVNIKFVTHYESKDA
jgi:hypothetical protein